MNTDKAICRACGHTWRIHLTSWATPHGSRLAQWEPSECPACGHLYWNHDKQEIDA